MSSSSSSGEPVLSPALLCTSLGPGPPLLCASEVLPCSSSHEERKNSTSVQLSNLLARDAPLAGEAWKPGFQRVFDLSTDWGWRGECLLPHSSFFSSQKKCHSGKPTNQSEWLWLKVGSVLSPFTSKTARSRVKNPKIEGAAALLRASSLLGAYCLRPVLESHIPE